jgi:Glycosyltransferase family 9 (heptosyltransferase)
MNDPFMLAMEAWSLQSQQKSIEALECVNQAIELDPDVDWILKLKGTILLALERYQEGWPLYAKFSTFPRPSTWNGEKTDEIVTIWDDQGYGDSILFARYLPLVKERCPNLQVVVKRELIDLFQTSFEEITFIEYTEPINGFVCPITNLGYIFQTTIDNIPNKMPYLFTNKKVKKKASIGITLKTQNEHVENYYCKCLFGNIGQSLFELSNSMSLNYEDLVSGSSFNDTAAIINSLDLVITIDTSVAHLAGALGKPTWLLLSHDCYWVWGQNKTTTEWYPSVELIRQKTFGNWQEVVDNVIKRYEKEMLDISTKSY